MGTMVALDQGSIEPLLSVTGEVELEWLRARVPDMTVEPALGTEAAELSDAADRLRPSPAKSAVR